MRKVAFHTLGCKVNQYETDAMQQLFESKGYTIVPFEQVSDIYVINTCTVTNMADKKSRQIINKAKKQNSDGVIVVVGCYAQAAGEKLEEDESIDLVIGNNKKNDILELVENYMNQHVKIHSIIDINQTTDYESLSISRVSDKTRAYIKVQDGCNQFCSYCIIPYMRGRVRSRLKEEVFKEVETIVNNGYKEIVLTGIHLASYGIDFNEKATLLDLVTYLHEIDGLERIRFGSLEPNLITPEFVKAISQLEKVCPHFHLSLQSGCDATLKRMNRKYTTESFAEKVKLLREFYREPALTTDIIVGFPGETDEDFQATYDFVKDIGFSDMHVFKYSVREGTQAASFKDQIIEKVKNVRSHELIKLADVMKNTYGEKFIGQVEEVLFEESIILNEKEYQVGHTTRYLKVAVEGKEDFSHRIQTVFIDDLTDHVLIGRISY